LYLIITFSLNNLCSYLGSKIKEINNTVQTKILVIKEDLGVVAVVVKMVVAGFLFDIKKDLVLDLNQMTHLKYK
jgi:hypothetical protein